MMSPEGNKSSYVSQAQLRPQATITSDARAVPREAVLAIAHRGDTKAGVENTLPAVESALKMGVDGVEVDLQLTRDGRVVLFHDDNLLRLGSVDAAIGKKTLAELKTLALSDSRSHQGTIPTLEDLLDLVRDRVLLNLEIKRHWSFSAALEQRTVSLLREFRLRDSILVSSFYPLTLFRMRRLAPEIARGYLFEKYFWIHRGIIPWVRPFSMNSPRSYATKNFVESHHRAGRRVFVWTVNDEDDMRVCMESGVEGIITDEPRRLLTLLNR